MSTPQAMHYVRAAANIGLTAYASAVSESMRIIERDYPKCAYVVLPRGVHPTEKVLDALRATFDPIGTPCVVVYASDEDVLTCAP